MPKIPRPPASKVANDSTPPGSPHPRWAERKATTSSPTPKTKPTPDKPYEEQTVLRIARILAEKDSGAQNSTLFEMHWREFSSSYIQIVETVLTEAARKTI